MSTAVQALPREKGESLGRKLPLWVFRVAALLAGIAVFFPPANPGRISEKINASASLFTNGVSYGTITNSMGRILRSQWIQDADITLLMIACVVVMLGVILCVIRNSVFPALKSVVKQVDPHAFMIVTKSSEVFGKGYENFNTERL